jgi:Ca2+-binding RTX toxin-like protein
VTTHTVSTFQQLAEALASASGGDRIELLPGDYEELSIQYLNFSADITITSADPDNPATFGSIGIYDSSHLVFDNISVEFVPIAETVEWSSAVRVTQSSDVQFLNSYWVGGNAVAGVPADSDPGEARTDGKSFSTNGVEGYPIGRAISVYHSEDVVFHNNVIENFKAGMILGDVDGLAITDNDMHGLRTVMVAGGDVSNAEITENRFSDLNPWRSHNEGDHSDFIHLWTSNNQVGPNRNIVIKDNFFEQGDTGGKVIGVYLEDNGKGIGYENVTIENNLLHNAGSQGFTIENTNGLSMQNNTLLQSSGEGNDAPGVLLLDNTRNAVIENNVLSNFWGAAYENADNLNIQINNNLFVQRQDTTKANFVGNLIVNPLIQNGSLDDFAVIPGSLAQGYGSSLTHLDGSTPFVAINSKVLSGQEMMSVEVAPNVLAGSVDLSGATINWDFGDGSQTNGASIAHTYIIPGTYQITATINLVDGSTQILHKTVEVESPFAVQMDFENGISDNTYWINGINKMRDVEVISTDLGRSLDLKSKDSVVRLDLSSELENNTEYTLSFDFRYDVGAIDGQAIFFPGTASIRMQDGEVVLSAGTDAQEVIKMQTTGANVDDGNWHQISLSFSQSTGTATFYLDGEIAGQIDGLSGSQAFSNYHGLSIGSPFGSSFTGQIDNLQFLRGTLSQDEVKAGIGSLHQPEPVGENVVLTDTYESHNGEEASSEVQSLEMRQTIQSISEALEANENHRHGTEMRDTLIGTDGADYLLGEAGIDILLGGGGDDVIEAGAGSDWNIYGGAGADVFAFKAGFGLDAVQDFEQGTDMLWFGDDLKFEDLRVGESNGHVKIFTPTSGDQVILYGAAEDVELTESDFLFDHMMEGASFKNLTSGLNEIVGTDVQDFLKGQDESEYLIGKDGNDILLGGGGDDVIEAGAGSDWNIHGGSGADFFVFKSGFGLDAVQDFEQGMDKLWFGDDLKFEDLRVRESNGHVKIFTPTSGDQVVLYGAAEDVELTESDFLFDHMMVL